MTEMRIDLHTHSNMSDGTDTPEELAVAAARAGLDVVALCDHDTMAGVSAAQASGERCGVIVQSGLETSTQFGDSTVHLLGYGCDPDEPALSSALAHVRLSREQRIPRMVDALERVGIVVSLEDIAAQTAPGATSGRPHVADAMVARGVVPSRREAFDYWLEWGKPGYVGHYRIPLIDGIALIQGAGGVAVIAHPWGHGTRHLLTSEVLVELAHEHGLDGLEVDHNDHDETARAELRHLAAAHGLLATGSSDYHGLGKTRHPLGCNTTDPDVFDAIVDLIQTRRHTLEATP